MNHLPHIGGRYAAAPFCLLLLAVTALPAPVGAETGLRLCAWHAPNEHSPVGMTDLLGAFHDRNPDLRVNINHEDWAQARVRLRYWCASHRQYAPDLTVLPDTWLATYADQLLPLDGVLKPKDTTGFVPAVLDRCRVQGRLVGLPWIVRSRALYYRADLLTAAKLEPPRTLADLQAVAAALSKPPEVYGLGLPARAGGGALEAFLDVLAAGGGQPLDADGRLQLQTKEAEAALAYWFSLQGAQALEPQGLTWAQEDLTDAFVHGRIAMLIAGPELHGRLRRSAPDLKFGVVAVPSGTGGGRSDKTGPPISVDVLVALASTQQVEPVGRFLRFMASAEAQRAMTFLGGLPTHQAYYASVREAPEVAPFVAGLERARGLPLVDSEAAGRIVEQALWLCLSGRATPAEALKTASEDEARRVL